MCINVQTPSQLQAKTPATTDTSHVPSAAARWGRFCTPRLQGGLGSRFHRSSQSHGGGRKGPPQGGGGERRGAPESWESRGKGPGAGWAEVAGMGRRWRLPGPHSRGRPAGGVGGKAWQREARARSQGRGARAAGRGPRGAARGRGGSRCSSAGCAGTPAQGRWEPSPRDLDLMLLGRRLRCRERQPVVTGREGHRSLTVGVACSSCSLSPGVGEISPWRACWLGSLGCKGSLPS